MRTMKGCKNDISENSIGRVYIGDYIAQCPYHGQRCNVGCLDFGFDEYAMEKENNEIVIGYCKRYEEEH